MLRLLVPKKLSKSREPVRSGGRRPEVWNALNGSPQGGGLVNGNANRISRGNTGPFESRGHLGNIHSWQLQPGSGYDPSVEHIDAAFGVPCETSSLQAD
jgi:hypothetical protein